MLIKMIMERFLRIEDKKNVFYLGIFVSMIGIVVGQLLFPGNFLPSVFFTVMPLLPFVNTVFHRKMKNRDMAALYLYLFLGMMIVFSFAYFIAGDTFDISIYQDISMEDSFGIFGSVLSNNTRIVFILFLLSILYGIGSLFILALNASLIGQLFSSFATFGRTDYFIAFLPHTATEFSSFFMAAIAGAIFAVAFTEKKAGPAFDEKVMQSAVFFMFAIILVILAALVESFLLPYMLLGL